MPRVICTDPNASELIGGVKFARHADGYMVSEEISQEQADRFCTIEGYAMAKSSLSPPQDGDQEPARKRPGRKKATAKPADAE